MSNEWTRLPPQESGFAPDLDARLETARGAGEFPNLHGVVALRGGSLVLEHYEHGDDDAWGHQLGRVDFAPDTLHDLRSVTKSVVGLLYGIALERGKVPSPEEKLFASFPQYADLAADPARNGLTVAHVLTMSMGLEWDENRPYTDPANSEIAMEAAPDRYRFILERPVVTEPGRRWLYNGGATALIGWLVAQGTGRSLPELADDALFSPLGITMFEWAQGSDGTYSAASGLRLQPRDLARIGQMVLQRGAFGDQVIVPSSWLDAALGEQVKIADDYWYGYHWYSGPTHDAVPGHRWFGAFGNGGQQLWIVPGLDLVIACTFGNYDQPDQRTAPESLVRTIVGAADA